jgi:hypothetical protein
MFASGWLEPMFTVTLFCAKAAVHVSSVSAVVVKSVLIVMVFLPCGPIGPV